MFILVPPRVPACFPLQYLTSRQQGPGFTRDALSSCKEYMQCNAVRMHYDPTHVICSDMPLDFEGPRHGSVHRNTSPRKLAVGAV